jgi:hypothetical protein
MAGGTMMTTEQPYGYEMYEVLDSRWVTLQRWERYVALGSRSPVHLTSLVPVFSPAIMDY